MAGSGRNYVSADSLGRTFAFFEVGGESFEHWSDYSITSDLLHGSDGFAFHSAALPREPGDLPELDARELRRGQPVKIYIKTPQGDRPVLQCTGRIEEIDVTETRDGGTIVSVTGADHMRPLVNCDLFPSLGLENITFAAAAKKVLTEALPGQPRPFFSPNDVLLDNDAARIIATGKAAAGAKLSADAPKDLEQFKVDQIKPHAGETIYQFLARHALRFGLLIWGTPDGKIVFGRPNYNQKPIYTFALRQGYAGVGNTVIDMSRRTSFKQRPSEIHVYGRSHGGDGMHSNIHAVAYDKEVSDAGLWGVMTVHDNNARTKEQAQIRANYELSVRRQTGDAMHVTVDGHAAADGTVFAIDTIASVVWQKFDINDDRYVISRTFTRSREAGTHTKLELVPKHSIAIGAAT